MKHRNLFPYFFFGILTAIIIFCIFKCKDIKVNYNGYDPSNNKTYYYLHRLNNSKLDELEESDRNLIVSVNNLKQNSTRIINPDKILDSYQCKKLDSILLILDKKEVYGAIAICEYFKEDDPQDFSMGIGKYLEIGGPKGMGFVVAIATIQRSYWISTGVELEKELNNENLADLENKYMLPYLKKEDWYNALYNVLVQINIFLDSNKSHIKK